MKKSPTKQRKIVRKKSFGFIEELNNVLNDYLTALNATKIPVKLQSQVESSR